VKGKIPPALASETRKRSRFVVIESLLVSGKWRSRKISKKTSKKPEKTIGNGVEVSAQTFIPFKLNITPAIVVAQNGTGDPLNS